MQITLLACHNLASQRDRYTVESQPDLVMRVREVLGGLENQIVLFQTELNLYNYKVFVHKVTSMIND